MLVISRLVMVSEFPKPKTHADIHSQVFHCANVYLLPRSAERTGIGEPSLPTSACTHVNGHWKSKVAMYHMKQKVGVGKFCPLIHSQLEMAKLHRSVILELNKL